MWNGVCGEGCERWRVCGVVGWRVCSVISIVLCTQEGTEGKSTPYQQVLKLQLSTPVSPNSSLALAPSPSPSPSSRGP